MTPPRTLVTGGTGFAGRFVVERLLAAGHAVTVWGRHQPAADFFSRPVPFIPGSLDPGQHHQATLQHVDFLVHAAFDHLPGRYRGGEGRDPQGFRRRNLEGSLALFEAARRAGVGRAVFLSSRAVYGTQPPGAALTEETEPRPDTLYGALKLETERALARMRTPDFEPVTLRVTGIYGPARAGRAHKWSELFADYLAGKPIEPRVATEVHGDDLAEAVRLALDASDLPDGVLNVSDLVLDRRDLLEFVQDLTKSAHPLPARADSGGLNVMDTARLRALGWRAGGWPLLRRTVRQLLADLEDAPGSRRGV